jgi:eukaryotic translation initiation factor 2C
MKFFQTKPSAHFRVYAIIDKRLLGTEATKNAYLSTFFNFAQNIYATGRYQPCGLELFHDPAIIPQAMKNARDKGANFALLILMQRSVPAYSIFKDLADRTYGMHSLCITEKPNYRNRALNKDLRGYFGNVMMKANLKAGGINHTVDGIADILKDTLVLGADVTHPGQSALLGTPSIAAIVGSVDKTGGKFLGSMRLQPRETVEMINDVESMVLERIDDWSKSNGGALPKNIIYYRDGVSDGQFMQVKNSELPQIKQAYAKAAAKRHLKTAGVRLTAITVMKRHNVRLYPQRQDADPDNGNCQPGTIVDSIITSPFYFDFYLQSHRGLKGTAKPTHYFVLVNEMNLSEWNLQSFVSHVLRY